MPDFTGSVNHIDIYTNFPTRLRSLFPERMSLTERGTLFRQTHPFWKQRPEVS